MGIVIAGVARSAHFQLLLALVPALLPVFFVITYAGWLWFFGHNMHPWGAFTVKPFMPTVFRRRQGRAVLDLLLSLLGLRPAGADLRLHDAGAADPPQTAARRRRRVSRVIRLHHLPGWAWPLALLLVFTRAKPSSNGSTLPAWAPAPMSTARSRPSCCTSATSACMA
jgi:hypothetical protein